MMDGDEVLIFYRLDLDIMVSSGASASKAEETNRKLMTVSPRVWITLPQIGQTYSLSGADWRICFD
ncbi:MAG: hypothetical protein ACLSB9_17845 [Hydrogeniiclostridium mannosilyticum]